MSLVTILLDGCRTSSTVAASGNVRETAQFPPGRFRVFRASHARGIPARLIQEAVKMGIAKVNTDSDLRLAALGRLRQVLVERPDIFNLYELMGEVEHAIRLATVERIRLLGSAGRA
jgi:fructose/tagatose bisphosphate aldolase